MTGIDARTVFLLAGVLSGFMAVILYSLKRSYPPAIQGLGEWSVALSLVSVGGLLAFGLGTLPDILSINLPRLLLPSGLLLAYIGAQRFFGITPRYGWWIVAIAVVVLLQLWFTFVRPSFNARLFLATSLGTCMFAAFANLMRKHGLHSFGRALTMLVLTATGAITLMRLVTLLIWPGGNNILETSPQHTLYVIAFSFCIFPLAVGLILMATERLHGELSYLAAHDSLTGALTRRHLNASCTMELERSARHGHSLALLVMDLDHFKAINDRHGHQLGDRVLVGFVKKVSTLLRKPDQLGRFGGEEFVALLPETNLEEALVVAERVRQACAAPGPEVGCTVSIGVTTNSVAGDTVDTLFARADAAMYRAKSLGRNRVETA